MNTFLWHFWFIYTLFVVILLQIEAGVARWRDQDIHKRIDRLEQNGQERQ